MALRVCARFFRESCRLVASARQESATRFPSAGKLACRGAGANGVLFTPVCFITSEAFFDRLKKGWTSSYIDHTSTAWLPPDRGEHLSLLLKDPNQPEGSNFLKVAVIGAPNAGKSTLSNQLLGKKVFAVSKKVHTTRTRALGVLTDEDTQIVLLDTPGLTTLSKVKKHQLEKSLLVDPWNTVKEADLIVVVVDTADRWTCNRLDFEVLKCLAQHPNIPAILVLNKVDRIDNKDRLLHITAELTCGVVKGQRTQVKPVIKPPLAEKMEDLVSELHPEDDLAEPAEANGSSETSSALSREQLKELKTQRGWPHFQDVFMLSSVKKEDVDTLKKYFLAAAQPGLWQYNSEVLTDQTPDEVCSNIIREKLLEYLPQEVPYSLSQCIEYWQEEENGELHISVKLYAKKETHMRMVIGTAGQMVARIASEAGEDLSQVFLRDVKLKLSVKLRS